jgi:RimJ/RimL family protein N-acetyltransferase
MKLDQIVNQPVIETTRFTLRPLRRSDSGLLDMYAGDERVARYTTDIPHPLPPGAVEALIGAAQSPNRAEDMWAMDGTKCGMGELMGVIGLEPMDRDQSEVGYWVGPAFWNTGIASEVVRALIDANPQGAKTIFASVFQDNPWSARVLTNAGFAYIGDAEAFSVARTATVPTWTYLKKMS